MNLHYLPENTENIVLITVDCLRRDHLEFYGYRRRTMPHLVKSVDGGLIIEEAHANSSFTRSSLPSLLHILLSAGRGPLLHHKGEATDHILAPPREGVQNRRFQRGSLSPSHSGVRGGLRSLLERHSGDLGRRRADKGLSDENNVQDREIFPQIFSISIRESQRV